jgi:NAD(P)-dependent dehydrogenase (short-subunit alcohol dehydrogenase family)
MNTVHATSVASSMVVNEELLRYLLDVPVIGPSDVIESMAYLCGHAGRYLTGVTLPVDAGRTVK